MLDGEGQERERGKVAAGEELLRWQEAKNSLMIPH